MGEPARRLDRRYTYRDLRSWPDDERWELIDGTAWNMSPAPSREHQRVSGNIYTAIRAHLHGGLCEVYAAPFDVFLPASEDQELDDVDTVIQPDLSVICDSAKLIDEGCRGAPDLVVEILSPWTSKKDLADKHALYERSGVREYWVIDPAGRYVHVYRRGEKGEQFQEPEVLVLAERRPAPRARSGALSGLEIGLDQIFG